MTTIVHLREMDLGVTHMLSHPKADAVDRCLNIMKAGKTHDKDHTGAGLLYGYKGFHCSVLLKEYHPDKRN